MKPEEANYSADEEEAHFSNPVYNSSNIYSNAWNNASNKYTAIHGIVPAINIQQYME